MITYEDIIPHTAYKLSDITHLNLTIPMTGFENYAKFNGRIVPDIDALIEHDIPHKIVNVVIFGDPYKSAVLSDESFTYYTIILSGRY